MDQWVMVDLKFLKLKQATYRYWTSGKTVDTTIWWQKSIGTSVLIAKADLISSSACAIILQCHSRLAAEADQVSLVYIYRHIVSEVDSLCPGLVKPTVDSLSSRRRPIIHVPQRRYRRFLVVWMIALRRSEIWNQFIQSILQMAPMSKLKKQTAETTLRCFLNVLRFFSGCKNVLTTVLFHFSQSEIRMWGEINCLVRLSVGVLTPKELIFQTRMQRSFAPYETKSISLSKRFDAYRL